MSNPYQFDNYKLFVKSINPETELLEIKNSRDEVRNKNMCRLVLKCKCGNIFELDRSNIKPKKKLICPQCACKKMGIEKTLKNRDAKLKYIESRGYEILSDTDYIETRDKVVLKNKDGYMGKIYYNNFRKGNDITVFSLRYNKEFFIYNANVFCNNNGLSTKVLGFADEQKWAAPGIKCQCKCGEVFETSIDCLLKEGKTTCNKCATATSKWCRYVENFFNENNIQFDKEVRFKDCKDSYLLPFDYQVNDKLIEVDGEQHFSLDAYNFGMTEEKRKHYFNKQKYHEKLKENFCKKQGIELLRISFKEIKDGSYKNKILEFVGA